MAESTSTAHGAAIPYPFETPNSDTPWYFSPALFERLPLDKDNNHYRRIEVQPQDPEFSFVRRYFQHCQPTNRAIKRIWAIHNWAQSGQFEHTIASTEQEATNSVFDPQWEKKKDPLKPLRREAYKRWEEQVAQFSPFTISSQEAKKRVYQHAKLLPMWHGSSRFKCESICQSGFTFFGKHKGGKSESTDQGFFGSGIYFTNSARYAADIYSDGEHLMLAWVSMRPPYPVVSDKPGRKCSDMRTLEGRGAYENYNAHYIPVLSVKPTDPQCAIYYPCAAGESPSCDELVVFQKSQTLPQFWVEMGVDLPHALSPKGPQADVDAFLDLLTRLLETDAVKQNIQLFEALDSKFTDLVASAGTDLLTSEDLTYFNLAKRLVTEANQVSGFVLKRLLSCSSAKLSSQLATTSDQPTAVVPSTQKPSPPAQYGASGSKLMPFGMTPPVSSSTTAPPPSAPLKASSPIQPSKWEPFLSPTPSVKEQPKPTGKPVIFSSLSGALVLPTPPKVVEGHAPLGTPPVHPPKAPPSSPSQPPARSIGDVSTSILLGLPNPGSPLSYPLTVGGLPVQPSPISHQAVDGTTSGGPSANYAPSPLQPESDERPASPESSDPTSPEPSPPKASRITGTPVVQTQIVTPLSNSNSQPASSILSTSRAAFKAFSPDALLFAAHTGDAILICQTVSSAVVGVLSDVANDVESVAFSRDGNWIATSGARRVCWKATRQVCLWDANTFELKGVVSNDMRFHSLRFSPDDSLLAGGGAKGRLLLWEVPSGKEHDMMLESYSGVLAVEFSPDGRWLASGGYVRHVRLWDVSSGQEKLCLRGHDRQIEALAFCPSGSELASAGLGGEIRLWSLPSGHPIGVLEGHEGRIQALSYSPDGRSLVSCEYGTTCILRLWRNSPWQEALSLSIDDMVASHRRDSQHPISTPIDTDTRGQSVVCLSDSLLVGREDAVMRYDTSQH